MDVLTKQSREVQVVIGGAALYLLFSFFHWQSASTSAAGFNFSVHRSEWVGIGVIACLLAIVLLLWEVARLLQLKIELGPLTPGLVSVGLALLLLVFTVITFLSHNELRKWPAWAGLVLSIAIAAAAWMRARGEGVQIPDMTAARASGSSSTSAPTPPAAPTPPPGDREPPPSV